MAEKSQMKAYFSTSADMCVKVKTVERAVPGSERKLQTPHTVRFIGGRYQTQNPEEIAAIERSPEFGSRIFEDNTSEAELARKAETAKVRRGAVLAATSAEAKAKAAGMGAASSLDAAFTPDA